MKTETKKKLERLIAKYGNAKEAADKLESDMKIDNEAIKSILSSENLPSYETAEWIVRYVVQKRANVNKDGLLEWLKTHFPILCETEGIIKTQEYIDFEALERAIYNEKISKKDAAKMDKFTEVKQVPTLKVSRKKGDK